MPKIVVTEPTGKFSKFSLPLDKQEVTIGSMRGNHIVLKSSKVSSRHCKIIRKEYGYDVIDLDSTYGSIFNGKKFEQLKINKNKAFYASDVFVEISFSEEELDLLVTSIDIVPPSENLGEKEETKITLPPESANSSNTHLATPPAPVPSYGTVDTIRAVIPSDLKAVPVAPQVPVPKTPEPIPDKETESLPRPIFEDLDSEEENSTDNTFEEARTLKETAKNISETTQNIDLNEAYLLNFERIIERAEIRTKFGGFPDWRESPAWPVDKRTEEQYRFVCQIKIDPQMFPHSKAKMAYFFIKDRESKHSIVHETAVILQPGDNRLIPRINKEHGPNLFEMVAKQGYRTKLFPKAFRQSPELKPLQQEDIELAESSGEPLNKVGGPPEFITSQNYPDNDKHWHLLFQLNKNTLPFELDIADDGVCYGFLDEGGTQCKVIIQRR